jgi:uncharacterized YkwD family protein
MIIVLFIFSQTCNTNSFALDRLSEINGDDKYEFSNNIATQIMQNTNSEKAIIVNTDKSIADSLSASALSGVLQAPIFMTSKDSIKSSTIEQLKSFKTIYILGREKSISDSVEKDLKKRGFKVIRLGGSDRIETSLAVYSEISKYVDIDSVALVNAYKGEADAVSMSPVSARDSVPIVLTDGQSSPVSTSNKNVYVIGGDSVMNVDVSNAKKTVSFKGLDRYNTNNLVFNEFYKGVKKTYITDGTELERAMSAPLLAKDHGLVLVSKNSDKSLLKGIGEIISMGNIDNETIVDCINVANSNFDMTSAKNVDEFVDFQEKVLMLVNKERVSRGIKELEPDEMLSIVATIKSADMAQKNYFSHQSPTYGTPYQLLDMLGVKYYFAGENIAYGQKTPEAVVKAWMNSESHKRNILNEKYTKLGVGIAVNNDGRIYWTQEFIG